MAVLKICFKHVFDFISMLSYTIVVPKGISVSSISSKNFNNFLTIYIYIYILSFLTATFSQLAWQSYDKDRNHVGVPKEANRRLQSDTVLIFSVIKKPQAGLVIISQNMTYVVYKLLKNKIALIWQ